MAYGTAHRANGTLPTQFALTFTLLFSIFLNSQGQDKNSQTNVKIPKLKSDKINVSAFAKAVIKICKCRDFLSIIQHKRDYC